MCEAACDWFIRHNYRVITDAQFPVWQSPIRNVQVVQQLRKDEYHSILERLVKSLLKLYRILFFPLFCKSRFNVPLFMHGNDFKEAFQKSDVILFAGCGGLTDKYFINVLMWWSIILAAKKCNKPVYITGVGIGPIESRLCRRFVEYITNNVKYITVRDYYKSWEWICNLNQNRDNYDWVPDDACFYNGYDTYSLEVPAGNKAVGIAMMSAVFQNGQQIDEFCQSVKDVLKNHLNTSLYFVSVTHIDYDIVVKIANRIGWPSTIIVPKLTPSATRNVISQLDALITSRYHGCIFAVSQKIPVIGIYGEAYWKYKIIGALDMFGCSEMAFDISTLNVSQFRNAFDMLLNDSEQLRDHLKKRGNDLTKKSYLVHAKICQL